MEKDWNAHYLANDMPWDKGEAAPPLVEYLAKNRVSGKVLIPGCGQGHDVRKLAQQGAKPLGLDIAPQAIELAKSFPQVGSEDYRLSDFLDLENSLRENFDFIFEHTCLCAIPPSRRVDYARSAHAALKSGGHLLGIFYVIVEDPDPENPPYPISPAEIDTLFSPYFETVQSWTPSLAFKSRSGGKEQMRLMRKKEG